jgi:hypothetical protein
VPLLFTILLPPSPLLLLLLIYLQIPILLSPTLSLQVPVWCVPRFSGTRCQLVAGVGISRTLNFLPNPRRSSTFCGRLQHMC